MSKNLAKMPIFFWFRQNFFWRSLIFCSGEGDMLFDARESPPSIPPVSHVWWGPKNSTGVLVSSTFEGEKSCSWCDDDSPALKAVNIKCSSLIATPCWVIYRFELFQTHKHFLPGSKHPSYSDFFENIAVQYQILMCTSQYAKLHIVVQLHIVINIAPCTNILRTPLNLSVWAHVFPAMFAQYFFSFFPSQWYTATKQGFLNISWTRQPPPPSEQQDQFCSHQELEKKLN